MNGIIASGISVRAGQLGSTVQTTITTDVTLYSLGVYTRYIINQSGGSFTITLPQINTAVSNSLSVGGIINIRNISTADLTIKDSSGSTLALSNFDGVLIQDAAVELLGGSGGVNDWIATPLIPPSNGTSVLVTESVPTGTGALLTADSFEIINGPTRVGTADNDNSWLFISTKALSVEFTFVALLEHPKRINSVVGITGHIVASPPMPELTRVCYSIKFNAVFRNSGGTDATPGFNAYDIVNVNVGNGLSLFAEVNATHLRIVAGHEESGFNYRWYSNFTINEINY